MWTTVKARTTNTPTPITIQRNKTDNTEYVFISVAKDVKFTS